MKLRDDLNALRTARAEYHAKAHKLTPPQIAEEVVKFKKLNQTIVDKITDGAKDCPDCGRPPHGMFHDGTPNPSEIGCVACGNHRIREALPDDAVAKWNAAKGGKDDAASIKDANGNVIAQAFHGYMPPRNPGTVVGTHRDETGLVKSQRVMKRVK